MRTLVLVLLLTAAAAGSAQTYKWRDAAGGIQYSDTPPPPGATEVQRLRQSGPASTAAPSAAAQSIAEKEAEFRKRLVEKQEAEAKQAKAAEQEQIRARNCAQAKGQLAALQSGARMVQLNPQGERIPLDDAGRERAEQDAQRAVESWCKK